MSSSMAEELDTTGAATTSLDSETSPSSLATFLAFFFFFPPVLAEAALAGFFLSVAVPVAAAAFFFLGAETGVPSAFFLTAFFFFLVSSLPSWTFLATFFLVLVEVFLRATPPVFFALTMGSPVIGSSPRRYRNARIAISRRVAKLATNSPLCLCFGPHSSSPVSALVVVPAFHRPLFYDS
eukprot:TRINITY_DN13329_c0_g1_i4.p2 TRINITY_DN13329_c0_g1~~TRINITY_DN13329_c0_g1_i4.p2  ORF type:complete len:181 (+),score=14.99 TRINITY_DN13329_c0_g1_i4:173-715(+)